MKKYLLSLILPFIISPVMAKTVNSSAEIEQNIKRPEIKRYLGEQINDISYSDGFGSLSRQDGSVADILTLIGHSTDYKKLSLLGVRKWYDGNYIVTACSVQYEVDWQDRSNQKFYSECNGYNKTLITLAVVKKDGQGNWQLVAKPYQEDLMHMSDEQLENSAFGVDGILEAWTLGNLDRLDFANYQLNQHTKAFGLRLTTFSGFAGGGRSHQNMTLFAIINGRLKPILNVPTYVFSDVAGEWNEDGSRQHDIEQHVYILKMSNQKTHGFYDIIWQEKDIKNPPKTIYQWNKQQQYYNKFTTKY